MKLFQSLLLVFQTNFLLVTFEVHFVSGFLTVLRGVFSIYKVIQLDEKKLPGDLPVVLQRASLVTFHPEPGRKMFQEDGVGSFVDGLTSWTRAKRHLLLQVLGLQDYWHLALALVQAGLQSDGGQQCWSTMAH